jgi:hypothetical protein
VSQQAFYSWKRRYAGLGLSELRELRQLREEEPEAEDTSGRPDAGQAYSAGGAVKKGLKPAVRRELVREVREARQLSKRRACGLFGITAGPIAIKAAAIPKLGCGYDCESRPAAELATDICGCQCCCGGKGG